MAAESDTCPTVAIPRRRRWFYGVVATTMIICVLVVGWRWATRPFRLARQFVAFVVAKQYEQAEAMLPPDQRRTIPPEFWKQFDGPREWITLSSPGPWTFTGGGMALTFAFKDPNTTFHTGCGIRFAVMPTSVSVSENTFHPKR